MDNSQASTTDTDIPLYQRNRYHYLVDSLTFVDAVPIELESRIHDLVAEEKRKILEEFNGDEDALLNSYIKPIATTPDHTDSTHVYHAEVERKAQGMPLQALDLDKYTTYTHVKDHNQRRDHLRILTEYAHDAQLNLEALDRYKENAWLSHLDDISSLKTRLSKEKAKLEAEIEQLNKDRKVNNIEWASKIRTLIQEYDEYKSK
ncbi:uncharacterized protein BXIN_1795 [Babesia sp. Xinjiang]|uniref:uncharacterized protein n=1 Tax=Babesia sp. Xinjiang TaxID=462227 RepID=UPI000A252BB4|nr:uncharacterized protein BXIN_1624 [Babesia sp. Xinjiang]XP_028871453.1 uncharacterized protein BXIN_1795 [Babesia sp. Xinjiang]ORM40857.1 hypothetical protein BXIN_1624 [Babesia sp. Xinjiang]ORM40997.1 hypothetical protein BXIN_1795 [Babesia sp. Xinjiang]